MVMAQIALAKRSATDRYLESSDASLSNGPWPEAVEFAGAALRVGLPLDRRQRLPKVDR
jgi:hypothetical protein